MSGLSASNASFDLAGLGLSLPSRDSFLKALTQQARLLSIVTALPDAALVVERFHGTEAISSCYRFEIDCLSSSAHLELKQLLGEQVSLRLLLADGRSHRSWHGIVLQAAQLGADGGLARYRLTVEPWFACLRQVHNSRIFQDKTAQQIVEEVFAAYPELDYEFRLNEELPVRSLCGQYRETDHDFVVRLFASEGLSFHFEHEQDAPGVAAIDSPASNAEQKHTRHKLVIFDTTHALPECPQAVIRHHRNSSTEGSDCFEHWRTRQAVTTNAVARASWDYRQLIAPAGEFSSTGEAIGGLGDVPVLEDYDGSGAYRHADAAQAERAACLQGQYVELAMQTHVGEGSVRQLAPGQQFTLMRGFGLIDLSQPDAARNRFTVLGITHDAANNLEGNAKGIAGLLGAGSAENGTYRNHAVCANAGLPVVPQPLNKPVVPGFQSAIVVGTENDAAGLGTHSDRDGRIRIQFPWQRGASPLSGGLNHDTERATGKDTNGTWVRVAESFAGPNWGSNFTPRVGSEVIVEFIEGDIDRPIVTHQMYNGDDNPPWPAGEGSSANHPGVIAGMHAPTLDGSGWSQWLIDDATGQLRTRLATSHTASQLNLGYLIHQGPTSSTRGAWRGTGAELRTDGWSVVRAAQGILLSTTARQNGASTQLDSTEAAGQLKAAFDTASRLSDAASQSEADPLTQAGQIDKFRSTIHQKDAPPDGTGTTDREVPSFAAAAILVEGPSSIALASPASTTLFASEHLTATAQADAQLTAQHTASFVAGDAASLYTHTGGINAIAANGPVSIQAHDGPVEILADKTVTVTSSNDSISVLANKKIVLQAGQSSITLEGGNITFACPGNFMVKGGSHAMAGGASAAASLAGLPSGVMGVTKAQLLEKSPYDEQFRAVDKASGEPIAGQPYRIETAEGDVVEGVTDKDGKTQRVKTLDPQGLKLSWLSKDAVASAAANATEQEC
ncbi:type VI secretion system Vgr family protein [Uliginosibacterium sp. H3]|uniref:Type VI secretion system Vgr family protein n=1 Tax=Uliginosibacterium silvisoli TaxID=3114758 RepID=A0ABU6JXR1_9RHOO|nr:type VI secretion system Vgr family protein [Uliginosibacterium sp. H3]